MFAVKSQPQIEKKIMLYDYRLFLGVRFYHKKEPAFQPAPLDFDFINNV